MRSLLFALLCGFDATSSGQAGKVAFGVRRGLGTRERLTGFTVEASDRRWGRHVEANAPDSGRYEMGLGRNSEWLVACPAAGYVSNRVLFPLNGPTDADRMAASG